MATLSANVLTLADWAKRIGPDGKIDSIVEMLAQTNEVLDDMLWREGNEATGHQVTMRTGLPTVAWRLINSGVVPSKSTTAQIKETTGILEAWGEVDVDLAKLEGDTAAFRLSEAQPFIEAMNQEMAQTLFYGNSGVSPEEFTGLSARYSSLSASVANSQNVISAGGSGSDNTSIWLIVWGEQSVFGIFPKGSEAGLVHRNFGEKIIQTATGVGTGRMLAYVDQWQWKTGLALKDWRGAVRICNIDVSNLIAESSAADLTKQMIKAIHRIPTMIMRTGRAVFYMNSTVFQMLDLQRRNEVGDGGGMTYDNVDGRAVYAFRGIPIRRVDQLLNTEAAVS